MMERFKTLTTGYKGKIPKGAIVEVLHRKANDTYTISDDKAIDYIHRQDLEKVEVPNAEDTSKD